MKVDQYKLSNLDNSEKKIFLKNEKSLKVPESLSLEFHKERRNSAMKAKIMTENFQNMTNDINLWIQTSQQVPKKGKPKKFMPVCITMKLLKT